MFPTLNCKPTFVLSCIILNLRDVDFSFNSALYSVTLIKLLDLSVGKAVEMGKMSSYIFIVNCDNIDEMFCIALIHIIDIYKFFFFCLFMDMTRLINQPWS